MTLYKDIELFVAGWKLYKEGLYTLASYTHWAFRPETLARFPVIKATLEIAR